MPSSAFIHSFSSVGFGGKKRKREMVRAANGRREEEEEGAGGWEWAVKQSAPRARLRGGAAESEDPSDCPQAWGAALPAACLTVSPEH